MPVFCPVDVIGVVETPVCVVGVVQSGEMAVFPLVKPVPTVGVTGVTVGVDAERGDTGVCFIHCAIACDALVGATTFPVLVSYVLGATPVLRAFVTIPDVDALTPRLFAWLIT